MSFLTKLSAALLLWNGLLTTAFSQQKFVVSLRSLDQIEAAAAMDAPGTSQYVRAASSAKEKLSLPLLATLASGGSLAGHTEKGEWIIDGPETASKALKDCGLVSSIGFDTPQEYFQVREAVLIYDLNNRPTREELADAGIAILEDQQRLKANYGYMKVASARNAAGIPATLAAKIRDMSGVESADANSSVTIGPIDATRELDSLVPESTVSSAESAPTNDPDWNKLWGLRAITAPQAWADGNAIAPKVTVAVVDTGIDYNHPDLTDNMWRNDAGEVGIDYVQNDKDPMDEHSHGTHCAGTIAAVGNNGIGVVGVTWETQLMALKFMRRTSDGRAKGSLYDAAKCIQYAVDNGAHVINNSWESSTSNILLEKSLEEAQAAGIVVIAAAGNGVDEVGIDTDTTPRYPASYGFANIISVAAIDRNERLTSFSNFGVSSVDLAAPGQAIYSTIPTALASGNPYGSMNGTSMAAPHVSGAAALMLADEQHRDMSAPQIRQKLLSSVRQIPSLTGRCESEGVLDLSFLSKDIPRPSLVRQSFRSAQFSFKENKHVDPGNQIKLAQLTIEVDQPVTLHIRANASTRIANNAIGNFAHMVTGFSPTFPVAEDLEQAQWAESLRPVTVNEAKTWVNFGSIYAVQLKNAGPHTIYWFCSHRSGAKLSFGSGSMIIDVLGDVP